ncbi:MAG: cytochrome P450 [Acidimicrobiales bacterium]|nr:cytochrome P450 [Acidimicrobiales bacterium]MDG1844768.1 cytochrome P450 [Acidimicrobiales bacterium]
MESEIEYNPFAPETLDNPFNSYHQLQDSCPVHKYEDFPHPLFTVTRYEDVVQLLTKIDLWSSHYGQMPRYSVQGCLFSDPPKHTWYRKLIQKSFAPRHVAAMEEEISTLVQHLLNEMESERRTDLHDALACPLPILVIAKILGVPTEDMEQFKAWSDEQLAAANAPDAEASNAPRKAMNNYLLQQINSRREILTESGIDSETIDPSVIGTLLPDDVITGILLAEVDGRKLDDSERLIMLNQLLVGGNETTTSLLTNLFWRLLENPELYNQVRNDPSLDAVAVEESLRMDSPVLGLYRTNTEDTRLHNVLIPEKSKVMATFGAANRDPEIFEDPDSFRLDRDPDVLRKHVAFGLGHHFCPGAQLSRLEAKIALRAVAERFPDLRLVGEPERIEAFLLWGKRTLPVRWD